VTERRPGRDEIPGERRAAGRRLERPPADRYQAEGNGEAEPPPAGSVARAVWTGAGVAVIGAVAITLAGGALTLTAGLIAVSGIAGWAVAGAVRAAGGAALTPDRRVTIAVALALAGALAGQVGLWLYARYQGGTLHPVALLVEVYGPLVLLELAAAGIVAWWTAR
jgi:hypothetical protein